ncbi:MAG: hypothetical protein DMF64_00785 [Acidobacteria bacterium]|nr:MAG: hypothetical protein DMF64_00785 [Acidobacteriota bacterium]
MSLSKRQFEAQQEKETPTARITRVRAQLRTVSYELAAHEGRVLDYETAAELNRALAAAMRELEALTFSVAGLAGLAH